MCKAMKTFLSFFVCFFLKMEHKKCKNTKQRERKGIEKNVQFSFFFCILF